MAENNLTTLPFEDLFEIPLRNGLTRPTAVRGSGVKMINMGELFAHSRIKNISMDRVPLSKEESENYLLKRGDLLFARQSLMLSGAGKCSIFLGDAEPVTYEGHIIRARLDSKKADPLFYYYYFSSAIGRTTIESIIEQVAAAGIRGSDLAKLRVYAPPLPIQHVIACILNSLDDKIELNRQMNATLEAMARAIFQSWFVDFDPVRAKAEGRQPEGMDAAMAALFPCGFEVVDGRKVPKGWGVNPLDTIAVFLNGLALQKYPAEIDEPFLPAIKIAQMHSGDTEGADKVSVNIPAEYHINDGDVLFSWSGSLEIILWCNGKGALNQHLFKVSSESYPKWFYYYWTLHHLPEFQLIAEGKATTMGHIQRHHLSEAMAFVPPPDLMEQMDMVMAPLLNKIINNMIESRTLANIRDALLSKLMLGEIPVKM